MRRTAWVLGGVAALVVGLVAWVAWPRPATAAYVTAPATRGTVTQTITLTGPVERAGQAELSFSTAGLVTAVHVRVGDTVTAGQVLVSVDPAPLRLTLLQARAQLAQAEAQLDADLTAQSAGTATTALGLTPASTTPTSTATTGTTTGTPSAAPTVPATEPAYLTELNDSLADLSGVVTRQQEVCTPVFTALQQLRDLGEQLPTTLPTALPTSLPTATPTATASPQATPTPSASPTPDASPTAAPDTPGPEPTPSASPTTAWPDTDEAWDQLVGMADQVQSCSQAMVDLADAEARAGTAIGAAVTGLATQTQQAQAAIAAAQAELSQATADAQAQVEQAAREAAEQAIAQAQAELAAQMAASYGGTVTDATIASDRARLVQARQQVEAAEADLAAATLTSPTSGVVGALDFTVGESSSGRSATVIGAGAASITVDVPLAVRALVAPGVTARVGQLAAASTLDGQVTSVSVLASGSGPTYSTVVVADDPDQTLRAGSWAEVTLALATASDVLTVPASAVTRITDTTATLEVVEAATDQTAQTVTVVTGRTGDGRVEIVSGLTDGAIVVLADRRLPVPGGIDQYQSLGGSSATPTPAR